MGYFQVKCPKCENKYKLHEDFNCVNCGAKGILKANHVNRTYGEDEYGCKICHLMWEWIECPDCNIRIVSNFVTHKFSFKDYTSWD